MRGLTSVSRGDGKLNVKVTMSEEEPGFLNVQMQWPSQKGEPPNLALMTIGPKDALTLAEALQDIAVSIALRRGL